MSWPPRPPGCLGSGHGAKGEVERTGSLGSKKDSGETLMSSLGSVSGEFGWLKDENGRGEATTLYVENSGKKKKRKCVGETTSKSCHEL